VYSNDNYQNDWEGKSESALSISGGDLPESTYYYLLKIEGEQESRTGYFTLWR
jgi:hypothetical protein